MDELVYPPRISKSATPPVDAVRGFVFLSGLAWFRKNEHATRYLELLPDSMRERVHALTATEWIPIDEALAGYFACDELGLSIPDQIAVGRAVSDANNGVVVTVLTRLIGGLGATPWLGLRHVDKVWKRSNRGGAVAVYKEGPRAARLEFWRVPLARSPFFVTSMRGAIAVGFEGLCDRMLVTDVPELLSDDGFALRLAW